MDPTETFNAMMSAYQQGEIEEAIDHARNLTEWLSKGGFAPTFNIAASNPGSPQFTVADNLARAICFVACTVVTDRPVVGRDVSP